MKTIARELVMLQFDVEVQVMFGISLFNTSMFSIYDEDYEAKMKYPCWKVLVNDMKAARREDPEDLFIKMEKRSQDKENTQPTKS